MLMSSSWEILRFCHLVVCGFVIWWFVVLSFGGFVVKRYREPLVW